MGSLEELLNSRYRDYQTVSAEHDTDYLVWAARVQIPSVLIKFKQFGEFNDPYYEAHTRCGDDEGYVQLGWMTYGTEGEWGYELCPGDYLLTSHELRAIADKLDELNAKLLKERTWLDRLFNM